MPRVLMGKRRNDLAFMPGKYVFPGGRVDKIDRTMPPCNDLPASEVAKLLHDMKGTPSESRARALAMASLRESFEEAGLLIGEPRAALSVQDETSAAPAVEAAIAKVPKGSSWARFCAHGVMPGLNRLTFFARAITPPGRPRRFDTRFFCVDASAICLTSDERDDELSDVQWLTLEETGALDLPGITRVILEDLADRLVDGALSREDLPVPYYYYLNGTFRRELITS